MHTEIINDGTTGEEISSKILYLGCWNPTTNQKEGPGIQVTKGKELYEGYFKNNMFEGKGRQFLRTKIYEGDFKEGVPCGKGTFYYASGQKYIGEVAEGKRNGNGVYYWPSGATFTGFFVDEQGQGQGHWIDKFGICTEGKLVDDRLNGLGLDTFPHSKSMYKGYFEENERSGLGTLYWKDGRKFIGFCQNNRFDGIGVYTTLSGEYIEADKNDPAFEHWWEEVKDGRI